MISLFRNLELSFEIYLKDKILNDWKFDENGNSLTYNSELGLYCPDYSDFTPSPVDEGRGWSYFDENNFEIEQSNRVNVYPATSVCRINYMLGGIQHLSGPVPTAVDYNWNYVSVIDEWPQDRGVPELPFIVVNFADYSNRGFQLGGGIHRLDDCEVHIFASSKAERDDLTDTIYYGLYNRVMLPLDFSNGTPIDFDGFFNTGYSKTVISGSLVCSTFFDNVRARRVNINQVSVINKFRSRISFRLNFYKETMT